MNDRSPKNEDALFRLLIEGAKDYAIFLVDTEGRIASWNSGAERILGYQEGEIVGQDFAALFTPEDRAAGAPQQELQKAAAEGRSEDKRWHLRRDGSRFWADGFVRPLYDEAGVLHGFGKVMRDATERKQAEDALRASQAQTAEILESITDAFYAVDASFHFTYVNRKAEELWGRRREELIGQHYWTTFPQAIGSESYEMHQRAMEQRRPLHYETLSPLTGRWVDVHIYPSGTGLSVYFRDTTERKQAEQRLRVQYAVSRALAEAEGEDEMATRVLAAIGRELDWTVGTFWAVDQNGDVLRPRQIWHSGSGDLAPFEAATRAMVFPPGLGLPGRAWAGAQTLCAPDMLARPDFERGQAASEAGLRAALAFPIRNGSQVVGVIEFFARGIREPDEELRRTIEVVSSQISLFLRRSRVEAERRRLLTEMQYLTSHAHCLLWHGTVTEWDDGGFSWDTDALDPTAAQAFLPLELLPGERYTDAWYRCRLADGKSLTGAAFQAAIGTNQPSYSAEFGCRGESGQVRWFAERVHLEPLAAEGALPPRQVRQWRVAGVAVDITDRKHAEEALRESEERYRGIVSSLEEGVTVRDAAGVLRTANNSAERILGLTLDQMRGRTSSDPGWRAVRENGEPFPVEEHPPTAALRTGQPQRDVTMGIQRPDGTLAWISAHSQPLFHPDTGEPMGVVSSFFDVTARKETEARLAETLAQQSRIAETLQRSMLLAAPEGRFPGLTVVPLYEPALDEAKVGGDFYDAFAFDDAKVALVVGDVSGKGLVAAARTAEVKYALRAFLHAFQSPRTALAYLNNFIIDTQRLDESNEDTFIVLALAVVDTASGEAVLAAAGTEPPLVLRQDNTVEPIAVGGRPLGAAPDATFVMASLSLEPGETIIMATDGITEARRGHAFFGIEGVAETAQQAGGAESPHVLAEAIYRRARDFAGGTLRDDACLLLARRQ